MRKFYGLVFFRVVSRISDGHPYPFYPEVLPSGYFLGPRDLSSLLAKARNISPLTKNVPVVSTCRRSGTAQK